MAIKKCVDCKEEKSVDLFHKKSSDKTGFNPQCKECRKLAAEAAKSQKSCVKCHMIKLGKDFLSGEDHCRDCIAVLLSESKKHCSDCKEVKCLDLFDKMDECHYRTYCSECRKAKAAEKLKEITTKNKKAKSVRLTPKKCGRCKKIKPAKDFHKHASQASGLRGSCKKCEAEIARDAKEKAKNKRAAGLVLVSENKKCSDCKEIKTTESFSRNDANKDGLQGHCRKCAGRRSTQNSRKKRQSNVEFKVLDNIRRRVRTALQRELAVKSNKSVELLGCSMSQFVLHLEQNFEPGMTWDNYGSTKDGSEPWVIDHEISCNTFALLSPAEQRRCFHFTNQQPMWRTANLEKGDKVSEDDDILSSLYTIFDADLNMW